MFILCRLIGRLNTATYTIYGEAETTGLGVLKIANDIHVESLTHAQTIRDRDPWAFKETIYIWALEPILNRDTSH